MAESDGNQYMLKVPGGVYLLLIESVFFSMSYFGNINPHPLGLVSGLSVSLLAMAAFCLIFHFQRFLAILFLLSYVLFSSFLIVTNWWYFQYFQSYYNYKVIGYGVDLIESARAVGVFNYKFEVFLFIFLVAFALVAAIIMLMRSVARKHNYLVSSFFLAIFGLACLYTSNISLASFKKIGMPILKPSYVHPVHAFFIDDDVDFSTEFGSVAYFSNLNTLSKKVGVYDFEKANYNVIYVMLESTRTSLVGDNHSRGSLTPNLDGLARSLVVSREFYANSNYTIKGELASWCGIFDHNAKPPISKSTDAIKRLQCLPKILAERGYETAYFHGNTGSFNSRKEFLPVVGFEHLYFPEDDASSRELPKIGWGISDEYMYQYMLDTLLSKSDRPFFAHFMTVSSHYPFGWDWGIPTPIAGHPNPKSQSEVYENYKNAVFYEDYALGKFWAAFKESPLYKNTIVVITADHGVWVFDDEENKSLIQKNEEFFRVPLLIYHPDIKEPVELTDTASQIDLPETVLNMLGIKDYDDFFVGKNLFETVENPWAIMMKQGDIVVRKNDTICYVEGAGCAGIQQDCVAIEYGELLPDINKLQRCQKITGDLLQDGGAVLSPQPADPDLMDKAFSLIRYHNKKVFMD